MWRLALVPLLLAIVLGSVCGSVNAQATDDLKARIDSAPVDERPELCIQIARRQLGNADKLYGEGNVAQASAAVDDVVTYSEKARDAATQAKKHLKNVEINVRKMSEKLQDIKRTLAFEDQPPVERAIHQLEDIRTTLLKAMFAKEEKKEKR